MTLLTVLLGVERSQTLGIHRELAGSGGAATRLDASAYCTHRGTLDSSCLENALATARPGQEIYVPAGHYAGTVSAVSASGVVVSLDPAASLDYLLQWSGTGYARSQTVAVPGGIRAGATEIAGDFSGYVAGETVLIEQRNNNPGFEIAVVAAAGPSRLTLRSALRFDYPPNPSPPPSVSRIAGAVQLAMNLARNAGSIPGDYRRFFAVGDIVRVENTTLKDDAAADTGYFELVRIKGVSATAMTLEGALHANYGSPWLVAVHTIANVALHGNGGFIRNVELRYLRDLTVDGLSSQTFDVDYAYQVHLSHLQDDASAIAASRWGPAATSHPVALGVTFVYKGTVSDITAKGAESSTDNGNVKIAQCDDLVISHIDTTGGIAHAEGSYPLMLDFDFPPYNPWNANLTISDVNAGLSTSGVSVYLGGLRDSKVDSVTSSGAIKLLNSSGVTASAISTPKQIIFWSGTGYLFSNVKAGSISIGDLAPVTDSQMTNFTISGQQGLNPPASVWIRNGSANWKLTHGSFAPSSNTSIRVNDPSVTKLTLDDISDAPMGRGVSIANPYRVPVTLGNNNLRGAVENGAH